MANALKTTNNSFISDTEALNYNSAQPTQNQNNGFSQFNSDWVSQGFKDTLAPNPQPVLGQEFILGGNQAAFNLTRIDNTPKAAAPAYSEQDHERKINFWKDVLSGKAKIEDAENAGKKPEAHFQIEGSFLFPKAESAKTTVTNEIRFNYTTTHAQTEQVEVESIPTREEHKKGGTFEEAISIVKESFSLGIFFKAVFGLVKGIFKEAKGVAKEVLVQPKKEKKADPKAEKKEPKKTFRVPWPRFEFFPEIPGVIRKRFEVNNKYFKRLTSFVGTVDKTGVVATHVEIAIQREEAEQIKDQQREAAKKSALKMGAGKRPRGMGAKVEQTSLEMTGGNSRVIGPNATG